MLDLSILEQKINTLMDNMSKFLTNLYLLYYSNQPQDISIQYIDIDGNSQTYTIPNFAKLSQTTQQLITDALSKLPLINLLDTTRLTIEDRTYIESTVSVLYADLVSQTLANVKVFEFYPETTNQFTLPQFVIPIGFYEAVLNFNAVSQKFTILNSNNQIILFQPTCAWLLIKPTINLTLSPNNNDADLKLIAFDYNHPNSEIIQLEAGQWNIVSLIYPDSVVLNESSRISITLQWQSDLVGVVECALFTIQNNYQPLYRPLMIIRG